MTQHAAGFCLGHNTDVFVRAVYRWVSALSGNEAELCETCCAAWRANAVGDPSLAPSRITLLERRPARITADTAAAAAALAGLAAAIGRPGAAD